MTTVAQTTANPSGSHAAHLSHSALSDLIHCGKAFQLSRVLHLPEEPGYARAGGHAVHAATERLDRQRQFQTVL